ncbi:hypothetical protein INS49_004563 [Diaporthe citri]|uniref:uncharacterized protein n=1 Tax=Diaporthe citri TaxID=83186 RepID=UPI001C7FB043|nr:uncharacterized protein INS49_004563 [Diaporthe citri]KAG6354546.1 hypothetical protein INS49_004563 [Diaporthe citri]
MAAERNLSSKIAEPLAIVGLSFKLPQDAVDEKSFWEIMVQRRSLLTDWPSDRACLDGFYKEGPKEPNMLPARGTHAFSGDPAVFDAPFFSITAKEASSMDPQQRWALEAAYHAFENAGIAAEDLRSSRTAVFSATFADDFARLGAKDPDAAPIQAALGSTPSMLPNRISWYFGLRGPSMHIDTACSGSMVAMDMACQSIMTGNASAALVIGSNIMLSPETSALMANMNFLSPDGLCFSFDDRANGYSRGEGVLAVVIKPLADALTNGDVIRAVVRSTASNHDGRTPILTQPSSEAQEALIRDAYRKAGLSFERTRYVEAHGTGTPVGDPIETSAIGKVFASCRSPQEPLFVGSVKANIGHLEGGSGLAAIVKAILVLEKGIIPPNALFERLNPRIDAESYNIQVPTRSIPWPTDGLRRISVNSFGVGGANSHIILDDAFHYLQEHGLSGFHHCDTSSTARAGGTVNGNTATNGHVANGTSANGTSIRKPIPKLLICSAADAGAANRMVQAYQSYYQAHINDPRKLDLLAYTLGTRRSIMPWRTFAVADGVYGNHDRHQLTFAPPVRASPEKASIGLVFTGQGAQYAGMGLELLQYPVFEASLRESDEIFASLGAEWSLLDALRDGQDIDLPQRSQPLCTALQIALVDLLRNFGVSPAGVIGHSSGEIAGAYTIGALSQRSACKVAYFRGQLAGKLAATTANPGAMISANLDEIKVPSLLGKLGLTTEDNTVHTACVNSPTNVTLSGPVDSIKIIQGHLDQQGVFAKTVNTGVAYHSPAMRAIATEYRALMGVLEPGKIPHTTGNPRSPATIMVSSVTGNMIAPKLLSMPDYWVDNLVSPVRFVDAMKRLTNKGPDAILALVAGGITDLIEVDGVAVCPGTGMVVMAVEAVQQMASAKDRVVAAFLIKEARFLSPVVIGETSQESTETELHVLPMENGGEEDAIWYETRIFTFRQNSWAECFHATIRVSFEPELTDSVDGGREQLLAHERIRECVKDASSICKESLPTDSFYSFNRENIGLDFKSSFQNLANLDWDGHGTFSARVNIASASQHYQILNSPVHPAVLDSCVQPNLANISRGLSRTRCPTMMAHSVENMWIAARVWDRATDSVQLGSFAKNINGKTGQFEASAYGIADDGSALFSVGKVVMAEVSRPDGALGTAGASRRQRFGDADEAASEALMPEMEFLLRVAARKALREVSPAERQAASTHLQKYAALLEQRYVVEQGHEDEVDLGGEELDRRLCECEAAEAGFHIFPLVARALPSLFRGETDPLELLFNSGAAEKFYGYLSRTYSLDRRLFEFISLASHEQPALRVIEVGAGTGAMTRAFMACFRDIEAKTGRECFYEFTYTDISPAFFEAARAEFAEFKGRISFKTLDLERDAASQGFELGSYDMAIASNVFHATSDLSRTLGNARKLLRQGGRLLFQEGVVPNSACFNVGFGCLEGWLLATEEWRQHGPLATEEQWHEHEADPHCALAVGFLRTLRSEEGGKHLVTLVYQSPFKDASDARFVSEVHQRCFEDSPSCSEDDFIVRKGQLTIGRLERAVDVQNQYMACTQPQQREERWPSGPRPGLALDVGTPGMLDTLRFVEDARPSALQADEVEIEAAAWGVGSRDVQIALGRLSADEEIGLECAGTVVRVGAGCADFQAGDRVLAAVPGCMRSHPRAPAQLVCKIPDGLSFSEAVAALVPGMMAYHSLVNVARVRPGHKVLIHAAAGATGQMMVAIAQMLGAEVFATVGSKEKKEFLVERFKLPTEHIFYSRNTTFAPGIMRATKGVGVDVVVNSLPAASLQASWECVAPYGHFIEIGKGNVQANSSLAVSGFAKNVSFTAVDMLHIAQTNHQLTRELAEKIIAFLVAGHRGPAPLQLFGAAQIEQAFRLIQSGANTGRVVISLSPEEVVPRYTTLKSNWSFRKDHSYLVAGGFGGLGQVILRWMVDRGARHLIVPSRSGPSSQAAVDTLAELTKRGVQVVAPRCDVSSSADLEAMLQDCAATMPPVKGCFNATMVLHDSVFENMTHSQWSLNIQSKVPTSWNLHHLLPKDMDFFILLSSLMGVYANPSQSNYAAGCVFQDTLARLRSAQGMRASVSLDIGYMRSAGYVARRSAESQAIRANARRLAPIETGELLGILGHYCDPALPAPLSETHSQLLVGARTALDYAARGEEPMPATLRPLFAGFNSPRDQDAAGAGRADALPDADPALLFRQAGGAEERRAVVTDALRAKVARALGVAVEDVDGGKTLADYGTDSLMAVELRSWMRKDFGADVTVFDMTSGKSINAVGELVVAKAGAADVM